MAPPKLFEPYLFLRRGRIWTIIYPSPDGQKKQKATKFRGPEQRGKAQKALALFTERLKAGRLIEGRDGDEGPLTVARWAKRWLDTRTVKGISTVDDYRSRLEHHALPVIGHLRLDAVTPEHITQVMQVMAEAADKLAPRSQLHVYQTMKTMFGRAVPRLLEVNPCSIHSEDLPQKKDADSEWRPTAIFSREEVQHILTAPEIPIDRRVFYGVMFLAGLRFGEISALHVRHYDARLDPLGQLQVGKSYNSKKRKVKGVKTDRPRVVPVHPWLKRLLGEWLALGWEQTFGRRPAPNDILIPTRKGTHRNSSVMWKQLNGERAKKNHAAVAGDLERIGLRNRRQHDARRTFITLARADGARKDLLRLVTHGPEGDIVDIYTEMPWSALCEEVAKLKLAPPAPAPLTTVPNVPESLVLDDVQGCQEGCHTGIRVEFQALEKRPQRDSNPQPQPGQSQPPPDNQRQPARSLGSDPPSRSAPVATAGQHRPMATMATLVLHQVLAALERDRTDQAKEIVRRAIAAEEANEGDLESGGQS